VAATGDVLVFLDADTEPASDAVALLAAAAGHDELVSVQPRHRVERAYERISAGPALVSVLGAGTGGPPRLRWWRRPMTFGPAIAIRRDLYWRFGGHAAARAEVVEDIALARAADRAGIPVRSLLGGDRLGYRMYPEGPGRLVEGWCKNLAAGAGATPPVRLAASVLWMAGGLRASLLVATAPGALTAVAYGAFAVQIGVLLHRIGRFGAATAALYPVVLVAFLVLFTRSVGLRLAGVSVPWRGRHVPPRR
jgi:4,4'-diaponeurosporenoate glycosyltransferase